MKERERKLSAKKATGEEENGSIDSRTEREKETSIIIIPWTSAAP